MIPCSANSVVCGFAGYERVDYAWSASPAAGQDCTYRNPPVRMMDVHGLEEAVKKMEEISCGGKKEKGRRPRLGSKASDVGHRRFYIKLADSYLKAVVLPEELKLLLLTNLNLKKINSQPNPKVSVPISWSRCYEYFVRIQWFEEDLVLLKGWMEFVKERNLGMGDFVVFGYDDCGFNIEVYKHSSSVQEVFRCAFHRM